MVAFLETISVVDLVCADLADALTGRHDGARVLAELAASHLFVQAVGQPGRWYRLHRLISDILRARPAPRRRRRDLHRRAAEWFRSNGMPLEAMRSAVAGELWPLAADLAGTHALTLIMAGRGRALERTLARIPRTVLGVHPELAGALAVARVALGSDAEVATLIGLGRAANGAVSAGRAARARRAAGPERVGARPDRGRLGGGGGGVSVGAGRAGRAGCAADGRVGDRAGRRGQQPRDRRPVGR